MIPAVAGVITASDASWIAPFTGLSPRAFWQAGDSSAPRGCRRTRARQAMEHKTSHREVRARVEHTFARMKGWKVLRDCRLKGDGAYHAMLGIARLHNLTLAG